MSIHSQMLNLVFAVCFLSVNPKSLKFIDENNLEIVFHGLNAVRKEVPYIPNITGPWDYMYSLNDQDIQYLNRNGFNLIRLGVMWPGVFPQYNQINISYLNEINKLINSLGEKGIFTIVDYHQDGMSDYFCGEGVPNWSVPYTKQGIPSFALPQSPLLPRDNVTHLIDRKVCLEQDKSGGLAEIVGYFFECFYNESCNPWDNITEDYQKIPLQTHFLDYWGNVSKYFASNPYVFGYDLMNEPSAGDFIKHPKTYLESTQYERDVLQPFYRRLMSRIWQNDKNHMILFEDLDSSWFPTGYADGGPGAVLGIPATKQVYTWHMYCLTVDENGDPIPPTGLCDFDDVWTYDVHHNSGIRIKTGQIIDEFGATPNEDGANTLLKQYVQLMSKNADSWAYWQYKPYGDPTTQLPSRGDINEGFFYQNGTLQENKAKILSHPYLQQIQGDSILSEFDFKTNKLTVKYQSSDDKGKSKVFVGELWQGFGHNWKVVSGDVMIEVLDQEIVITNMAKEVVEVVFW